MGLEKYRKGLSASLTQTERDSAAESMKPEVMDILVSLDYKGRWVDTGTWMITCRTFVRNMNTLCRFLELSGTGK